MKKIETGKTFFNFIWSFNNSSAQDKETGKDAVDILRETMKAIAHLAAFEYEVQTNIEHPFFPYQGVKVQAIIATESPLRAVVRQ